MKLKQRLPLRQGHDHSPRNFGIFRQTCVGRFAAGRAVRCAQWSVQFGRHRHASTNAMASPTGRAVRYARCKTTKNAQVCASTVQHVNGIYARSNADVSAVAQGVRRPGPEYRMSSPGIRSPRITTGARSRGCAGTWLRLQNKVLKLPITH